MGKRINYYRHAEGYLVQYRMNSDYDTPEERRKRSILNDERCKIDSCKIFHTCDRKQVAGKNVKCINYEKPF